MTEQLRNRTVGVGDDVSIKLTAIERGRDGIVYQWDEYYIKRVRSSLSSEWFWDVSTKDGTVSSEFTIEDAAFVAFEKRFARRED